MTNSVIPDNKIPHPKRQQLDDLLTNYFLSIQPIVNQALIDLNSNPNAQNELIEVLTDALVKTYDYLTLTHSGCRDAAELIRSYQQASNAIQELNWLIYRPNSIFQHVCAGLTAIPMMLAYMLFFGFIRSACALYEHFAATISLPGAFIGMASGLCIGAAEGGVKGYLAACQFNRWAFFDGTDYQTQLAATYTQLQMMIDNTRQVPVFIV